MANPVIFVDEFDNAGATSVNTDPYRPYYTLFEPDGARLFVDEYLGFPMDASHVIWVMSANSTSSIPDPILDRLIVLRVPDLDACARRTVAVSVYGEVNSARRNFFTETPEPEMMEALGAMSPRAMRIAIERAMVKASAEGRHLVRPSDLPKPQDDGRRRIGFV